MFQSQREEYLVRNRRKAEELCHGKALLVSVEREDFFFFSQRKIEWLCLCSELVRREIQTSRKILKLLH